MMLLGMLLKQYLLLINRNTLVVNFSLLICDSSQNCGARIKWQNLYQLKCKSYVNKNYTPVTTGTSLGNFLNSSLTRIEIFLACEWYVKLISSQSSTQFFDSFAYLVIYLISYFLVIYFIILLLFFYC